LGLVADSEADANLAPVDAENPAGIRNHVRM
jgi:hypothetical protein